MMKFQVFSSKEMSVSLNNKKRFFIVLIAVILSLNAFCFRTNAISTDYVIEKQTQIPIPNAYVVKNTIDYFQNFSGELERLLSPEDLFINAQGDLFVADTGNNRIVKLSSDGTCKGVFSEAGDGSFNAPSGVFADEEGNMYIADTGNGRIIHLSANGEYVETFGSPQSDLLDEDFTYNPSKLFVSKTGYIYVVKDQTVMILDGYNQFRGYLGQAQIGYSLIDSLVRIFATDVQQSTLTQRRAAYYLNICPDPGDAIYATTLDHATGEIKKLNAVGNNIYKNYGSNAQVQSALNTLLAKISFADETFYFGERVDQNEKSYTPIFTDIAVDENQIVTVIEEQTGMLYQYSQSGDLIAAFGGKGDFKGKFNLPSSVAVGKDGCIYVLDKSLGSIQIFEPTNFIKTVQQAVNSYYNGDYETSYQKWNEVLKSDENYKMAHIGIAQTYAKRGQYQSAMDEYYLSDNRSGYSDAFYEYRREFVKNHFLAVVGIIALALVGLAFIIVAINRNAKKVTALSLGGVSYSITPWRQIRLALASIRHPVDVFSMVKGKNNQLSIWPSLLILVLAFVVRIVYIFTVHFPLSDVAPYDANIWFELIKMVLPPITFVIASMAVTSIIDGESKLKENFFSAACAMLPYILITTILIPFSHILSRNEIDIFSITVSIGTAWMLFVFLAGFRTLNGYSLAKTVGGILVTLLAMLLIWAVCILTLTLVGQVISFISGLLLEIKMLY